MATARKTKNDLIDALMNQMPKPGTYWPFAERHVWLELATHIFNVVYTDEPPKQRRTRKDKGTARAGTGPEAVEPGSESYDPETGELREDPDVSSD